MKKQKDGFREFSQVGSRESFLQIGNLLNLFDEKRQIFIIFLNFSRDHHLPRGGAGHELQDKEELLHDAHPHRPGKSSLLLPQLKLNFWDPRDSVQRSHRAHLQEERQQYHSEDGDGHSPGSLILRSGCQEETLGNQKDTCRSAQLKSLFHSEEAFFQQIWKLKRDEI